MTDGAIDNEFADAEQQPLHVGDHVTDRDGDDEPMLVYSMRGEIADEFVLDGQETVADYNPDYPATDEVVHVCYPQRTDKSLKRVQAYAFPRSRLELVASLHDEDGGADA